MARGETFKSLAEQIAELERSPQRDYDPENIEQYDSDNSAASSKDDAQGREHYEAVGESKLRKRQLATLGPRYEGSRVTRDDIEDEGEDSDDPFATGRFNSESESESEPEPRPAAPKRTTNGVKAQGGVKEMEFDSAEEDEDEGDDEDMDDLEDMSDVSEGSDEEDESDLEDFGSDDEDDESIEDTPMDGTGIDGTDRAELRKIMAEEQKQVTATINEAARADVAKGQAVQLQRKTFDSLLNSRMRLQKALIGSNSLAPSAEPSQDSLVEQADAIRAAETAALSLWTSLNDLRSALATSSDATTNGATPPPVIADDPAALWSAMSHHESHARAHRNATLQKWSHKTRNVAPAAGAGASRNKFSAGRPEPTLIEALQSHVADPARAARARIPRSCAPAQAAKGLEMAEDIYDDADFYSTLLQELLSRRGAAMDFDPGAFSAMKRSSSTKVRKREVDRKASRGRKLKYTVHEKLVSFMAPEDRGTWGDRRCRELFAGLFGQKVALDEDEDEEAEEVDEEVDALEEGLRLFRS